MHEGCITSDRTASRDIFIRQPHAGRIRYPMALRTGITACTTSRRVACHRHVGSSPGSSGSGSSTSRTGAVQEIQLRPLSRGEVAGQVAGLVGEPPTARVVDELYSR